MTTNLRPHRRGDTFEYSFTLGNGWVGSDFSGGVKWTLREYPPDTSVTTDTDAAEQASVAGGQITFFGAVGTIRIAAARTTTWPTGTLYWDLQGVISGAEARVYTIDDGRLSVLPDITRST